jgi:hypothetical protein
MPTLTFEHKYVGGLVVGKECVVSCNYDGEVMEWDHPDPTAAVEDVNPLTAVTLWHSSRQQFSTELTCMQVCPLCLHWVFQELLEVQGSTPMHRVFSHCLKYFHCPFRIPHFP